MCGDRSNNQYLKKIVGLGYLKFEDFKKFVDTNPDIREIELSRSGEMFLNPELKEIIKYAYSKRIDLTAYGGVNFNDVSDDVLECLVKYKFTYICVSIDGASNETYKMYRVGGNFNKVINNIKKIKHYKKIYNTIYPIMVWKFIVFGHNEHEITLAKKKAEELSMAFITALNCLPDYSPIKDFEFVEKEGGLKLKNTKEMIKKDEDWTPYCICLFYSPQINWDGKLFGCCVNVWSDFGNVFEEGLDKCLNSERYKYAKDMLLGKKGPREDIPCSKCEVYNLRIKNNPLKELDINISDTGMRKYTNTLKS